MHWLFVRVGGLRTRWEQLKTHMFSTIYALKHNHRTHTRPRAQAKASKPRAPSAVGHRPSGSLSVGLTAHCSLPGVPASAPARWGVSISILFWGAAGDPLPFYPSECSPRKGVLSPLPPLPRKGYI